MRKAKAAAGVTGQLVVPAGLKDTKGTAMVQFFDGPHDPLTFLGPIKVLDAKMTVIDGYMAGGGLGVKILRQSRAEPEALWLSVPQRGLLALRPE